MCSFSQYFSCLFFYDRSHLQINLSIEKKSLLGIIYENIFHKRVNFFYRGKLLFYADHQAPVLLGVRLGKVGQLMKTAVVDRKI